MQKRRKQCLRYSLTFNVTEGRSELHEEPGSSSFSVRPRVGTEFGSYICQKFCLNAAHLRANRYDVHDSNAAFLMTGKMLTSRGEHQRNNVLVRQIAETLLLSRRNRQTANFQSLFTSNTWHRDKHAQHPSPRYCCTCPITPNQPLSYNPEPQQFIDVHVDKERAK